ncbi:YtcA family lipoprotein [Oceanomicrobium pacificus]|uniref:Uncharacterized protein YtcA n=1 Tax=Oceanomicrobium pacificus TaxID=2692916 RepID=A0A6B0TN69_9RHOB|nr:YtcA family lipoprotein [Oceanomicrobium pacificus]MXU66050.1 hypothetical protein [Oceanomicrobium pacificus]
MLIPLPDTIVIFGSYFPAWIFCLLAGLALPIAGHFALLRAGLIPAVPLLPLFYLLLWLSGGLALWLIFFGRW